MRIEIIGMKHEDYNRHQQIIDELFNEFAELCYQRAEDISRLKADLVALEEAVAYWEDTYRQAKELEAGAITRRDACLEKLEKLQTEPIGVVYEKDDVFISIEPELKEKTPTEK